MSHPPESKASPRRVEAAEREAAALALRRDGRTFAEIGAALGVTGEGARQAVTRALANLRTEAAEEADGLRALEDSRLDALLRAVWPQATAGDLGAVDVCLRIAARRARLWGLDAPAKLQADVRGGPLLPDREQVLAAARAVLEGEKHEPE